MASALPSAFGLSETEKVYRVALSHCEQIGARRFQRLHALLGSAEAVWHAQAADLIEVPHFSKAHQQAFFKFRNQHQPEALYEQVLKQQLQLCFPEDPDYPPLLKQIYDPPFLLYWRGQPACWQAFDRAVAVIGTRQPTAYGSRMTRKITHFLSQQGAMVVSGLALGIDAIAHATTLQAGGQTTAVLGCGLARFQLATNQQLFEQLCEQGLVISEFAPHFHAQNWTFPLRNRLVSGLCQAVVVIEAGIKSGTLITVDCANEQGREVFALPGPIDSPQSKGTHALIQQGAHLLANPAEIPLVLGWQSTAQQPLQADSSQPSEAGQDVPINLTNAEKQVYVLLRAQPQQIDQIALQTELPPQEIFSLLTILELKGVAEQLPGKLYKRKLSL